MARKGSADSASLTIKPEPSKFDDHFLDVVGNASKSASERVAEWLKNWAW
jgi:hypothetical protein